MALERRFEPLTCLLGCVLLHHYIKDKDKGKNKNAANAANAAEQSTTAATADSRPPPTTDPSPPTRPPADPGSLESSTTLHSTQSYQGPRKPSKVPSHGGNKKASEVLGTDVRTADISRVPTGESTGIERIPTGESIGESTGISGVSSGSTGIEKAGGFSRGYGRPGISRVPTSMTVGSSKGPKRPGISRVPTGMTTGSSKRPGISRVSTSMTSKAPRENSKGKDLEL